MVDTSKETQDPPLSSKIIKIDVVVVDVQKRGRPPVAKPRLRPAPGEPATGANVLKNLRMDNGQRTRCWHIHWTVGNGPLNMHGTFSDLSFP